MLTQFKAFFQSPIFPADDEKTRKAGILNSLIWGIFVALAIHLSITLMVNPIDPERIVLPVLVFPFLILLRVLLNTGYVEAVSVLMIAGLFAITSTQMPDYGGVRSPAYAGLTVIVLFAGLLLGFRAGIIVAIFSIMLGFALAVLEVEGLLIPTRRDPTPWSFLISNIAFTIAALSVLFLAIRNISQGLLRASRAISDRDTALEKLSRTETRYRAIVEDQTELINRSTLNGVITYANKAYADLFDCAPEELIGKHLSDFLSGGGLENIANVHARLSPTNPISTTDHKYIAPDGTVRWLHWSDRLIFNAQDEPVEFQGVGRDITELKRLEQSIRESEARFRGVAESAFIGIGISTPDDVFIYVNPTFAEMVGYRPSELIGKSISILLDEDTFLYLETKTEQRKQGRRDQYEITMHRKDGTPRNFKVAASPLMGDDGEFEGTLAVVSDVTAQRKADFELQRQVTELKVLHNVSTEVLVSLDEDELIQRTTRIIGEAFYPDHFGVLLLDSSRRKLTVHPSYHGLPDKFYRTKIPVENGVTGAVARDAEPRRMDDVSKIANFVASTPNIRSELCVPLHVSGELVGVINAESTLKAAFSEADERLLMTVSGLLGAAIEKARIYDASQRLSRELEIIYQTNLATGELHDPIAFLKSVCDHIQDYLHFDRFIVVTSNHADENLEVLFAYESGNVIDDNTGMINSGDINGPANWVREHSKGLLIKDTTVPPQQFSHLYPSNDEIGSMVAVPLIYTGQLLGVLMVQSYVSSRYDRNDLNFLESLAPQVAITLENNRLYLLEQAQRSIAEALRDTAVAISSTLDLQEVMSRILENLSLVVPYDCANIMVVDEPALAARIIASRGYEKFGVSQQELDEIRLPLGDNSTLGTMFEKKQPIIITDITEFPDWLEKPGMDWIRSYISVPIIVEDTVIGFVNLDSEERHYFNSEHAHRLQSFANQAAIAIENATLYQELEKHTQFLEEAVSDATNELRQQKERIEVILRNSPDAVVLLTTSGTIELTNQAFENLFDYAQNEILGQPICVIAASHETGSCISTLKDATTTMETERVEIVGRTSNDEEIELELSFSPIIQDEITYGIVCTLRDISAVKEVERLKDAFVSNVSHELRTPITSLKLNHNLLIMNPENQSTYLDRVGREINRLNSIIEDLLYLSRLDQEKTPLRLETTNVGDLLKNLIADRIPLAEANDIDLHLGEIKYDLNVSIDPGLLSQALSAILTNAIHYTPKGGWIRVSTNTTTENDIEWLGFEIADSGAGISDEDLPHLFSRFYRGQAGTESGKPGTGLGLSIANEVASKHQGWIEVQSQPQEGVGAVFTIWLPITEIEEKISLSSESS